MAVVGYTNAGKTSLIKALTNDTSLQPKNQLFATLGILIIRSVYNWLDRVARENIVIEFMYLSNISHAF